MQVKLLRLIHYLVVSFLLIMSNQAVEAHDKAFQSKFFYKLVKHDVTGDKKNDQIELKGKINKKNSQWVHSLKLTVKSNEELISIPIKSGKKPKLAIGDFNHDGVTDVLITMKKKHKSLFSKIYSFNKAQISTMDMPPPIQITAQFQDRYLATIQVEGQNTTKVDLKSHRDYYERLGIYNHGKLNEATELIVNPYSAFTVSKSMVYAHALLGKQTVKGIDAHDSIAKIITLWSYQDGNWELKKIKIKPVKKKK